VGLFEVLSGGRFRRQAVARIERNIVTDIVEDRGRQAYGWPPPTGSMSLRKDGAVQRIGKENGLPNNWVNALLLDRAGRLWAGTRDGLVLAARRRRRRQVWRPAGLHAKTGCPRTM
jgi:ligand-binding sensor domain-containing protein